MVLAFRGRGMAGLVHIRLLAVTAFMVGAFFVPSILFLLGEQLNRPATVT